MFHYFLRVYLRTVRYVHATLYTDRWWYVERQGPGRVNAALMTSVAEWIRYERGGEPTRSPVSLFSIILQDKSSVSRSLDLILTWPEKASALPLFLML